MASGYIFGEHQEFRDVKLTELHTHLLGMGNSDFWLNAIINDESKFPAEPLKAKNAVFPMIWNEKENTFFQNSSVGSFFEALLSRNESFTDWSPDDVLYPLYKTIFPNAQDLKKQLEAKELQFKKAFSLEIIIAEEHLSVGLDIDISSTSQGIRIAAIAEKLCLSYDDIAQLFDFYLVWNARDQELKFVFGVKLSKIRSLMSMTAGRDHDQVSITRAHLANCFTMQTPSGKQASSIHFHAFRGAFTPQFYPRRYSVKDSLYHQRLDILLYLLSFVLKRYETSIPPVEYVEFSHTASELSLKHFRSILSWCRPGDFSASPWLKGDQCPWIRSTNVHYFFLAAFSRGKPAFQANLLGRFPPHEGLTPVSAFTHYPGQALDLFNQEIIASSTEGGSTLRFQPALFEDAEGSLDRFQSVQKPMKSGLAPLVVDFRKSPKSSIAPKTPLVVGFDLVGDELGFPYCPFVSQKFLSFFKEYPFFGIRIHGAENVPLSPPNHGDSDCLLRICIS